MNPKTELAVEVIKKSLRELHFSHSEAHEATFHLTDWVDDLKAFVEFLESPTDYDAEEVRRLIIAFVIHAPEHLRQAAAIILEGPSRARSKKRTKR